ncbi:hypothetical protein DSL72_007719 [Monilinia vaccinii-corymbosi]|uniref:N-acetyltransferase domain-containing protein n=1 Tax=Monilinia vaccinii-corymbosi TaxID=61207 RepID=A0A8A3PIF1_9HELO|nr:hypothetical protein DSL72_007719 [Monilinia vaccinii-corymbosi]
MSTTNSISMSNNAPPPPRALQSTIRSFFQPQQPIYTAPPADANGGGREVVPPPVPASGPPKSATVTASLDFVESPQKLPQGYKIEIPQDHHMQALRRINALLLPIPYPDAFYHAITSPPSTATPIPLSFSRVVTYTSSDANSEPKVIGSLICRVDPSPPSSPNPQPPANTYSIYLQSLTLLSPYRTLGLATALLNSVIETATSSRIPMGVKIEGLYAHVWIENQEALEWYIKRGFEKGELIEGYYRRLRPQGAWVFRRRFSVQDHISRPQANYTSTPALIDSAESTIPPPTGTSARTPISKHTASFQDRRPDREWNDLPEEVLLRPRAQGEEASKESSRSSSRSRASGGEGKVGGKKKRSYPAAAFGGV